MRQRNPVLFAIGCVTGSIGAVREAMGRVDPSAPDSHHGRRIEREDGSPPVAEVDGPCTKTEKKSQRKGEGGSRSGGSGATSFCSNIRGWPVGDILHRACPQWTSTPPALSTTSTNIPTSGRRVCLPRRPKNPPGKTLIRPGWMRSWPS
jgi:hypothetical protein